MKNTDFTQRVCTAFNCGVILHTHFCINGGTGSTLGGNGDIIVFKADYVCLGDITNGVRINAKMINYGVFIFGGISKSQSTEGFISREYNIGNNG